MTSFETLYTIQADLLTDPERWPVIKGTGGARKGRVAAPKDSRGKSGSFREQINARTTVLPAPQEPLSQEEIINRLGNKACGYRATPR